MTLNVTDRLDTEAAWITLSEAVRTAIGSMVLASLAVGDLVDQGHEVGDERLVRIGFALERRAEGELEALLDGVVLDGVDLPSGQPRIPSILGMICESCGCSEYDACPGGCGWARDHLCTACVERPA